MYLIKRNNLSCLPTHILFPMFFIPFCRLKFVSGTIQLAELSLTFLAFQVYWQQIHSIFIYMKVLHFFLYFSKDIFVNIQNSELIVFYVFFPFSFLKILFIVSWPSVFGEMSAIILSIILGCVKCFLLWLYLKLLLLFLSMVVMVR